MSGCQKSPQSSCMPNNHQGGLIPGLFQLKKKTVFIYSLKCSRIDILVARKNIPYMLLLAETCGTCCLQEFHVGHGITMLEKKSRSDVI